MLIGPPLPEAAAHVWSDFHRLNRRRRSGMSGPDPIALTEIEAYERKYDVEISPEGMALLDALEDAYLMAAYQPHASR